MREVAGSNLTGKRASLMPFVVIFSTSRKILVYCKRPEINDAKKVLLKNQTNNFEKIGMGDRNCGATMFQLTT
jgi:hypothetical protein